MADDPRLDYHIISDTQRTLLDALCRRVLAGSAEFPLSVVVEHWQIASGRHTYCPCFQYRATDWLIDIMGGSVSIYRDHERVPKSTGLIARMIDVLHDGSTLIDRQDFKTDAAYLAAATAAIDKAITPA